MKKSGGLEKVRAHWHSDFQPFDPLQQLAYAGVVFLLAPFMLLTGAAMSPAIEERFPWYIKIFGGGQSARSLHFLSTIAFTIFIIIHTALVLIVHFVELYRNQPKQATLYMVCSSYVILLKKNYGHGGERGGKADH